MCKFCINLNNTEQDHGLDTARSASTTSRRWPRNAHRPHTCGRPSRHRSFDTLQIQKQILILDPVLQFTLNMCTLIKTNKKADFCQGQ